MFWRTLRSHLFKPNILFCGKGNFGTEFVYPTVKAHIRSAYLISVDSRTTPRDVAILTRLVWWPILSIIFVIRGKDRFLEKLRFLSFHVTKRNHLHKHKERLDILDFLGIVILMAVSFCVALLIFWWPVVIHFWWVVYSGPVFIVCIGLFYICFGFMNLLAGKVWS